jgi:hypothetical protein
LRYWQVTFAGHVELHDMKHAPVNTAWQQFRPAQPELELQVSPQTVPLQAKPLHEVKVGAGHDPAAQLTADAWVQLPVIPMQPQLALAHWVVG